MKIHLCRLNGFVWIGFYLNVLTIQHKYHRMLARNVKINGVAFDVETVCALHIEVGPTFL